MTARTAPEEAGPADQVPSVDDALALGQRLLHDGGFEGPRRDARLLLAAVLEASPAELMAAGGRTLTPSQFDRYQALVERRMRREPVSRILARREFWGLGLAITPDTLDPRPDSEILVEAVLARVGDPNQPRRVLDLGTGSGNLLLAVLAEMPGAWGLGLDRSPAALAVARENARATGMAERVCYLAGDWGAALAGGWDIVLCNPPYIRSDDIELLAPDVADFEPRGALDGGSDGLAAYRRVVPELARLLSAGGFAALELGAGQAAAVENLALGEGLEVLDLLPDLAGIQRCLLLGKSWGS